MLINASSVFSLTTIGSVCAIAWLMFSPIITLQAQETPDWMFALEGRYVGRFEEAVLGTDELLTFDVRIDGLRNGKEDGFVLQLSTDMSGQISEAVQMWNWNRTSSTVDITVIAENQPQISEWFYTSSGFSTLLTRGTSEGNVAAIERWRLERLPGQLRWDKYVNFGDGNWQFRWRYVLDEQID
jgi:hypothetical protein